MKLAQILMVQCTVTPQFAGWLAEAKARRDRSLGGDIARVFKYITGDIFYTVVAIVLVGLGYAWIKDKLRT